MAACAGIARKRGDGARPGGGERQRSAIERAVHRQERPVARLRPASLRRVVLGDGVMGDAQMLAVLAAVISCQNVQGARANPSAWAGEPQAVSRCGDRLPVDEETGAMAASLPIEAYNRLRRRIGDSRGA